MRYDSSTILKDSDTGRRYFTALKYPDIPLSSDDIYFISVFGDRLDQICAQYYGNVEDYWIIATANNLKCDSLFITPGTQIRVPNDTVEVKRLFNELNNKI